ncbi:uncharacterized protein LOC122370891 [Amphibalanus amphitrite]|uniref:uncharacterized protein LOC122370891 n=1 Tax=Amphibalanus amphitrite TaxID=1232801 RepID=UPI001C9234D2|nr:uncharacterized protein LOC122370891 [Amphibalanus amphitrite]
MASCFTLMCPLLLLLTACVCVVTGQGASTGFPGSGVFCGGRQCPPNSQCVFRLGRHVCERARPPSFPTFPSQPPQFPSQPPQFPPQGAGCAAISCPFPSRCVETTRLCIRAPCPPAARCVST